MFLMLATLFHIYVAKLHTHIEDQNKVYLTWLKTDMANSISQSLPQQYGRLTSSSILFTISIIITSDTCINDYF